MANSIQLPRVSAANFTATEFDSAAGKAAFLRRLAAWIINGMQQEEFVRTDKPLYYHLSMHFGHIAHYNRWGFYDTWFTNDNVKYHFLQRHAQKEIYGDPAYTWSDVERRFKAWILTSGILELWQAKAAAYLERANIQMVKHGLSNLSEEAKAALIAEISGQ